MSTPRRNTTIQYINPDAPELPVPEIKGERYQATVPDTLDLGERARHAVHGLTATTDPDANGELYWLAAFGWKPPAMYHDANDWVECKFFSPSLLLRQACGSEEGLDAEWHRMTTLMQMRGPDGLLYIPLVGRPWGREFGGEGDMFDAGTADHMMPLNLQGRYLSIAATYHALTGDPRWLDLAEGALRGLRSLAIDRGDFAYFHKSVLAPGEQKVDVPVPPPCINHLCAWVGNGLMDYYRMTGSVAALGLATRLARLYSQGHSGFVGPNGEFQTNHGGRSFDTIHQDNIHFHCNTHIRMLMLDVGLACDDREMIDLALAGYQFGKDHGDTLMGYFPENVDADKRNPGGYGNTAEICEVAEMIYLALRQSTSGLADCWDDVDRWMRNMFAESQLLETDWAFKYSEEHGCARAEDLQRPRSVLDTMVAEGVPERVRGTWGGWLWPNDWQSEIGGGRSVMHCCTGNMAMHFYRVLRDMVSYDSGNNRFSIHLLMNRASRHADVASHIPYRGQVDVTLKQDCEVALRIPEWTSPEDCRCTVNGEDVPPKWDGRYLVVQGRNGDEVKLHCPIEERTETRTIMGKDYRVTVRGNEIVDIDPGGEYCPIFHRPQYRPDETQWMTAERFVSDSTLDAY